MAPPGAAPANPDLAELALRLPALAAGNAAVLRDLHPLLHRIVVAPTLSGSVKTLVVQALLLLDDPRVLHGAQQGVTPLVQKIRKLLESALAAHESGSGTPTPALGNALTRAEFTPDALLSPDTDPALVEEFVVEAREQLAIAEGALLILDADPGDMQAVDTMFRALHSIKGTSAFLGVEHATELAHHAESALERVRAGETTCTGPLSNLLFRTIDMLDAMLVAIESVADGDMALLPDGYRELLEVLRSEPGCAPVAGKARRASGAMRVLRSSETTVRVRASDLHRLSELVEELSLSHAMVHRDPAIAVAANASLVRKIAHASHIALELQRVTTELHTVSFATILQRMARLVRDAAQQSGKSIELAGDGGELMLERATAELLTESLMHMVRNAVDHGIETRYLRETEGKPPTGSIRIIAQRIADLLVVEVSDDGRGLDPRRLARNAIDRGIVSADLQLSEQEAFALILRPGFSTAAAVTELSGRGVGMDVVRANVETLGGTIDIDSRQGKGTTFTIRLPFRSRPRRGEVETWGEEPMLPRTIGLIA
jgi:two-component system chemotaxis sensor kinase CheA